MKKCSKCKTTDERDFAPSQKYICRKCMKDASAASYRKHKDRIIQLSRTRNQDRILKNREYLCNLLRNSCCVDCGEDDPVVMEFDHVRGVKCKTVSELVAVGSSLSTIQTEIDKCDLVCANCHRKRTAKKAGNWCRAVVQ